MRVKTEQRRQAIIETAKREFISNGFTQTSMSKIAKQVGGSKATLYNYFNSKEEIFEAVMESVSKQMVVTFCGLSKSSDIKTTLVKFGINYLISLHDDELSSLTKIIYTESGRSDISRKFYEKGPKIGWSKVTACLDAHVDAGTLSCSDTNVASMQLKGLLEAETRDLHALGVISKPEYQEIEIIVNRAIDCFLSLYRKG